MKQTSIYLAFAIAAAAFGSQAYAGTYSLTPNVLTPTYTSTSPTLTEKNSTGSDKVFSDDFTFMIDTPYSSYFTASFVEAEPTFAITSADLTLYSGSPGSGSFIATTHAFDPITSPAPTLSAPNLGTGSYYIEASVTVPAYTTGSYSIVATASAAPEASTWTLMIAGVGLIGAAFRFARSGRQVRLKPSFAN